MNELNKRSITSFFLLIFIWGFFFIYYASNLGIINSILTILLAWSFFILCIPMQHGKIVINVPATSIFHKKLNRPEIYLWIGAIIFNFIIYFTDRTLYLNNLFTHLLLIMYIKVWPQMLLIFANGFLIFFDYLFKKEVFFSKDIFKLLLKAIILVLAYKFLYKELVILLNVRA